MRKDTEFTDDADDEAQDEQENQDALDEVGESRRDETTGSLESFEDLRTSPEEMTGRAGETSEDLTALFRNASGRHVTDGFRGGSDEEGLEESPGDPAEVEKPTTDSI